jgi:C4-dicarboxylate-binding protein DctP
MHVLREGVNVFRVIGLLLTVSAGLATADPGFRLSVAAPDADHPAWAAARQLTRHAKARGLTTNVVLMAPAAPSSASALSVLPVHALVSQVPALQVLELPFLFPDLTAVHAALDGGLGDVLRAQARAGGWEILAFWDEGMQAMSGNRRYDRPINLTGMEFLLLRDDPVAERQFLALDAWTRTSHPKTREELLRECKVGSRAATLLQLSREQLFRVHLDLSLTNHRYEGWVLVAPLVLWQAIPTPVKTAIEGAAVEMRDWQRNDAAARERAALKLLSAEGMQVHELDDAQRRAYKQRAADVSHMLPARLDAELKARLLRLAAGGAATIVMPRTKPSK